MASGISNFLANSLLNNLFRGTAYSFPATIAYALCTAAPTDASTGATLTEVANSGSYARVALNPGTGNYAASSGGSTSNSISIVFGPSSGSWGTITHLAIVDSATYGAGNLLAWGLLTSSPSISTGTTVTINSSNLTVSIA